MRCASSKRELVRAPREQGGKDVGLETGRFHHPQRPQNTRERRLVPHTLGSLSQRMSTFCCVRSTSRKILRGERAPTLRS